jgi:hypothetical protein
MLVNDLPLVKSVMYNSLNVEKYIQVDWMNPTGDHALLTGTNLSDPFWTCKTSSMRRMLLYFLVLTRAWILMT